MKRIIFLAAAVLFLLNGCSPIENRLDKRLIIQGIGIDKSDGDYRVTAMYMDTANPVGEADVTSELAQGSGQTVLDALTDTVNKTGKEPLYGQCSFIVLGKSITEEGIRTPLEFFTDYYEFHPNINVFCSDTDAEKIMKSENMNDRLMADFADAEANTGQTIISSLKEIYSAINDKRRSAATSMVGIDEKKTVLKGAAAFDGDRLKTVLDSDMCMAVLLLCGDANNVWDIFPSEQSDGINYFLSNPETKTDISTDGGLSFNIAVYSHAGAYTSENESRPETRIEARIKSLCEDAVEKFLREKRLDLFNFERRLYLYSFDYYSKLKDPKQAVALSDINISVDIELQK